MVRPSLLKQIDPSATFLLTDINEYFKHGISVAGITLFQERGGGYAVFAFLFSGMLLLRGEEIFLTL